MDLFPASLDSRPGTHRVTPERQPPSANMPSEVSPRGSYCLDWGFWLPNASRKTLQCQFTNAPFGFSFHAQTCSV